METPGCHLQLKSAHLCHSHHCSSRPVLPKRFQHIFKYIHCQNLTQSLNLPIPICPRWFYCFCNVCRQFLYTSSLSISSECRPFLHTFSLSFTPVPCSYTTYLSAILSFTSRVLHITCFFTRGSSQCCCTVWNYRAAIFTCDKCKVSEVP